MYTELSSSNFEIIAAAQDTGGEAAAGKWYDAAKATYTALVDVQHAVSSAFQFVNVPTGVWINEKGRVVRPGEPAWNQNRAWDFGDKRLTTEGDTYVRGLRDWVINGDKSAYALSDDDFARRVKSRTPAEMEADATFKLGVWFQGRGNAAVAAKYFERAQQLNPADWNYHRQEWSFTPEQANEKWLDKFKNDQQPYYPKLEMPQSKPKP